MNEQAGRVREACGSALHEGSPRAEKNKSELYLIGVGDFGFQGEQPLAEQYDQLRPLANRETGEKRRFVGQMFWNHLFKKFVSRCGERHLGGAAILFIQFSLYQSSALQCIDAKADASRGSHQLPHELSLQEPIWRTGPPQGGEYIKGSASDIPHFEPGLESAIDMFHDPCGSSDNFYGSKVVLRFLLLPAAHQSIDVVFLAHSTNLIQIIPFSQNLIAFNLLEFKQIANVRRKEILCASLHSIDFSPV